MSLRMIIKLKSWHKNERMVVRENDRDELYEYKRCQIQLVCTSDQIWLTVNLN